jgi:transposase InsO family protein
MDFVGPFPESKGYNYLWVIICHMISMVHLVPLTINVTALELSWKYLREVVRLHGLLSSIVSDRYSKFTSRWWKELQWILGTRLLMSTSFHPQTDGQSERAIRNVTQILRTYQRPDQKDWVDKIDMVEFAINSSVSESMGYAPFELSGGYIYAFHDERVSE